MKQEKLPYKSLINPVWIVLGVLGLIIIPFSVWASYAHLDQISHASGQVIATAKTQEIQSAIDGVIEEIFVDEGHQVKQGQELVVLEKEQAQAAFDESKSKVAALEAALVRLNAEVYEKPLSFSPSIKEYPEFVENQTALFHRRQRTLNDELSALNESLDLAKEELGMNLPLLKSGDIGAIEIIRLKRQIAELKGKMSNVKNTYFKESQTDMTKVEEELSTKKQELADKEITLERTTIYAPMDAIVKNIIITTQGAKVRAGDVILELVPFGDKLIIEAKMSPSDISFVKKGQLAAIKLDAYDYSIYGIFHGKVEYISPDTILEKTQEGDKYYFRVLIVLDKTELVSKDHKKIELTPGMTAQIDIITGNRSVLTYLTKPIIKTFSEAFHER
ncbi:MAG TPA: HlyD family efflux transporter periplasmic adaptor subunit [Sulfurovum sp.]|jgi:HlyD family secretion protein/adhesin transport system membrane fusion protein|nr:HlyD family efflux transporter periplasmic adaptor subunit [Sulfurovum sp.]HQS71783.1 HlyD family efflux transporter periplasmic adaptor subunit [Sulfurovum sp.]HQS76771.1 HlyD family efflux transporter periplasmic adaptor subunit [Sulfurovum sp.]HQT27801.1 HlyD family efflux transporter periplasmic adaptor subunit [Sulfurovum sp.]